VTSSIVPVEHRWTAVAVTYEPDAGTVEFHARGMESHRLESPLLSRERMDAAAPGATGGSHFHIGAARAVDDRGAEHTVLSFNGRRSRSIVFNGPFLGFRQSGE